MLSTKGLSRLWKLLLIILVAGLVLLGFFASFGQFNPNMAQQYLIAHRQGAGITYFEWDEFGNRDSIAPIFDPDSGDLRGFENSSVFAAPEQDEEPDQEAGFDGGAVGAIVPRAFPLGASRPNTDRTAGAQLSVSDGSARGVGFSCVLEERVDFPLLKITGESDTACAVLLEDETLFSMYTDESAGFGVFPGNGGGIQKHYDGEPLSITVSLPAEYVGKTLTVLQVFTPGNAEVWKLVSPYILNDETSPLLYVGEYGSNIFTAGLVAAILIILLVLFAFQLNGGAKAIHLLLPIAFALLQMIALVDIPVFGKTDSMQRFLELCGQFSDYLSGDLLLVFIALKLKDRLRFALLSVSVLHFAIAASELIRLYIADGFIYFDNKLIGIFGFACFVFTACLIVRTCKSHRFFRLGAVAALIYLAGYASVTVILRFTDYIAFAEYDVFSSVTSLHFYPLLGVLSVAAFIFAVVYSASEFMSAVLERRTRLTALEQLNRLKSDFLAAVAHEIKTPLTVLMGSARDTLDLLEESPVNINEIAEDQRLIERTVKRIDGIVLDLMDTAALETGRLTLKRGPVSLPDLLRDVCDSYVLRTDCRGNRLVYDLQPGQPEVWADSARIEQVMVNLLSNAVKHTKDGTITIGLIGQDGRQTVSVTDTGSGMSAAMQRSAFKQYTSSGDDRWRHGIGLYLCRQILLAHGGEIRIDSERGCGTRVSFTLSPDREDAENGGK